MRKLAVALLSVSLIAISCVTALAAESPELPTEVSTETCTRICRRGWNRCWGYPVRWYTGEEEEKPDQAAGSLTGNSQKNFTIAQGIPLASAS